MPVALFAALILAAGLRAWSWRQQQAAPVRIAVLPLVSLSPDSADEYFADGLTDEVIRNLSVIEGMAVRSSTSSFAFKNKPRNVVEVGRQLQAEYLVEGSVLRTGTQVRINARLVRVRDDLPLWSEKYDRELNDLIAIQEEISNGIVNNLRLTLRRGRRRYETSPEAYSLYLKARALQAQGGQRGADESIAPLEEAIAKDRSFAPAYAGLAAAYAHRSNQTRFDIPSEVVKLRAVTERAIQLDPLLAEAHAALGMAHARNAKWQESERSFRRAIELDPNRSTTRMEFAYFLLWPLNRFGEAFDQMRVAEEIDPLSVEVQFQLGWSLLSAGRYEEAAYHCGKLPAGFGSKTTCLGRALAGRGKNEEAIRMLSRSETRSDQAYLGYIYGRSGRREEAERLAVELSPQLQKAIIFAGLGDKRRTLEALDRNTVVGPVRTGWILSLPEFGMLRGDPGLKALWGRIGLPE